MERVASTTDGDGRVVNQRSAGIICTLTLRHLDNEKHMEAFEMRCYIRFKITGWIEKVIQNRYWRL